MKAKLNEFLDKMQMPVMILMLCFLPLFLIFAGMLYKHKEELKEYREFRLENFHCRSSKNLK